MRRSLVSILAPLIFPFLWSNPAKAQYDDNFDEGLQQGEAPPEGTAAPGDPNAAPDAALDYETFHNALSPYGTWIYTAEYGWVWSPDGVGQDWVPYQDGEWEWSAYGWTWVGVEPWAWGPYHYGRWCYLGWGWGWVPGYVWGPAWVSWRWGDAYVGWTPLCPGWGYGAAWSTGWPIVYSQWSFVGYNGFYATPINHATVLPPGYVQANVWNSTHSVGAVTSDGITRVGPAAEEVTSVTGHAISPVTIRPAASMAQASGLHALQGDSLHVFAPSFHAAPEPFAESGGRIASEVPGDRTIGVGSVMASQERLEAEAPNLHGGGVTPYHGALPGNAATQRFGQSGPGGQRMAQAPSSSATSPSNYHYNGNVYRPPGASGSHIATPPHPSGLSHSQHVAPAYHGGGVHGGGGHGH